MPYTFALSTVAAALSRAATALASAVVAFSTLLRSSVSLSTTGFDDVESSLFSLLEDVFFVVLELPVDGHVHPVPLIHHVPHAAEQEVFFSANGSTASEFLGVDGVGDSLEVFVMPGTVLSSEEAADSLEVSVLSRTVLSSEEAADSLGVSVLSRTVLSSEEAADSLGVSAVSGTVLASGEEVDAVLFPNVHALIDAASRPVVIATTVFLNLFVGIFSTFPAF
jgi:hypothetical protein